MKSGRTKNLDEINITPLTDIFLVLLIIMMVVMPLYVDRQLSVNMHSTQEDATTGPETPDESKAVRVAIDALGAFTIDGMPVSPGRLMLVLSEKIQEKPGGVVLLTHVNAPFESMAKAMDAAELVNIKDITIVEVPDETVATAPAAP